MPCHDPLPAEHAEARKGRLDFLTKHLCRMFGDLERVGQLPAFSSQYPELARWWEIHKKEDAMREALERKRVSGEPLTNEELSFAWSAFS